MEMITDTRLFQLNTDQKDNSFQKLKQLYTETMPLQKGYLGSRLILSEDEKQVIAISNWESSEYLVALLGTDEFQNLDNRIV